MRPTYHSCLVFAAVLLTITHLVYSQAAATLTQLSQNIELSLSKVLSTSGTQSMSLSSSVLFGIVDAQNNQGQSQSMIVDLNFNQIYVPDGTTSKFGITCDPNMQCSSVGQQTALPSYGGLTPQGKSASTFFRFDGSTSANSTMPTSLDFSLASLNSDWTAQFLQNGLLGMGPTSPLWPFLKSTYSFGQDHLDITFHLQVKDSTVIYDLNKVELSTSSKLIVNDQSTSDSTFTPSMVYTPGQPWSLMNSTIRFSKSFTSPSTSVCIDNSAQAFFMVSSKYYSQIVQNIYQQLCGNTTGCQKSNTRVADLDNIILTVPSENGGSPYVLTLLGKEFVDFDSQDNTLIGISPLESSQSCSIPGIDFGLGRLLLTQIDVTLRMMSEKPNTFKIGVRDASNNASQEWKQVLIVSAVSFGLSSLVTLFLIKKFLKPAGESSVEETLTDD
jgi:hypothetical protein